MRNALSFPCGDAALAATLDAAPGASGLLIVSGGNEIRCGAHRGMAMLAARIAAAGHPVLRFDRRGIGDSEGENGGFESSRADIIAALAAFRRACPEMKQVVAFGNCDAASALLLHQPLDVDALVLANPWTIEGAGDDEAPALPPAAAIKARYWQRLRDPASLPRLLRGEIDLGKLGRGLAHLMGTKIVPEPRDLAQRMIIGLASYSGPVTFLTAKHDRTAQAFEEAFGVAMFALSRENHVFTLHELNSASHSFAGPDADWLTAKLLAALANDSGP